MKRIFGLFLLLLFFPTLLLAKGLIFAYGSSCLCRHFERSIEVKKGWKLYCYYGNPYKNADSLKIMAKLSPDIVFFPKELFSLFVHSGFTGSLIKARCVNDFLCLGLWAGSVSSDADEMLKYLFYAAKRFPCIDEADVSPRGWWLYRLSQIDYKNAYTPINSPIKGIKSGIYRYRVSGYPRKVFLALFDKRRAISSLHGIYDITYAGNVYLYPYFWRKSHSLEYLNKSVASHFKLDPEKGFFLFTGADIDTISFSVKKFKDITVWAAVTAGVLGNAVRSGIDKGEWLKENGKWVHVGTINIILFVNKKLSDSALVQSIIRITEAKSAVLQELNVESSYTPGVIATGTGTDNVIVVSGTELPKIGSAGGHTKLGELMAKAVREALFKALYNQDGLSRKSN